MNKFIYWTPRIISIIFILFLAMFSLDVFGQGYSFWQVVVGLFMHNIPSLALLIILLISWKYEIVGGIAYILAGLFYVAMIAISALNNAFAWYMISYILIISGPAFIIGVLFLLNWKEKNKIKNVLQ